VTASHSAKPRTSSCVRTSFYEAVKGRTSIGVNLVVFCLNIDDNEFLSVLLNVNLGTNYPLEDFIAAIGEFRFFLGHDGLQSPVGNQLDKLTTTTAGDLSSESRKRQRGETPPYAQLQGKLLSPI
jgi:hypothetical protein